jgi:hypothetical protein
MTQAVMPVSPEAASESISERGLIVLVINGETKQICLIKFPNSLRLFSSTVPGFIDSEKAAALKIKDEFGLYLEPSRFCFLGTHPFSRFKDGEFLIRGVQIVDLVCLELMSEEVSAISRKKSQPKLVWLWIGNITSGEEYFHPALRECLKILVYCHPGFFIDNLEDGVF